MCWASNLYEGLTCESENPKECRPIAIVSSNRGGSAGLTVSRVGETGQ